MGIASLHPSYELAPRRKGDRAKTIMYLPTVPLVGGGRHYKDEAIFRYSSSANARHVCVRMFPCAAVVIASFTTTSSFGASEIATASYSPVMRQNAFNSAPAARN